MSGDLIVLLPAEPEGSLVWGAASGGKLRQWGEGLRSLRKALGKQPSRLVAAVPGFDVSTHRIALPMKSHRQALAAARFAIEDDIAQSAEEVMVALGEADASGLRTAYAFDSAALGSWLERCRDAGFEPTHIAPDFAFLPAEPGAAAGADLGDRVIFAVGGGAGFALDPEHAPAFAPALLERADVERLTYWGGAAPAPAGCETDLHKRLDAQGFLRLAAERLDQPGLINLLGVGAREEGVVKAVRPFVRLAAMAAAALAVYAVLAFAQGRVLQRGADNSYAYAQSLFRDTFDPQARLVNVRAQTRRALDDLRTGGGGGYLELSTILYGAVQAAENVTVESLRFDKENDLIAASVVFSDLSDMTVLAEAVRERGGELEEGASRSRGGQFIGDIVIRRPG